jgi:hypothetical protein
LVKPTSHHPAGNPDLFRTEAINGNSITETQKTTLPGKFVWVVLFLCILPGLLNLMGVDFGVRGGINGPPQAWKYAENVLDVQRQFKGEFVHTILEWSAFCIALCTVVFAFTHYFATGNVTTPVVGTALFFSGMIDAFHTLASNGLIEIVADRRDFIVFTWAISRTFNVFILIAGTAPFLARSRSTMTRSKPGNIRLILKTGLLCGISAYAIMHICAVLPQLPRTVFPKALVSRPWDAIPLVLYLLAGGIIFPRFHRLHPSLFSHGLIVSVIPHVVAQFYAAFGSTQLYDNQFNIAYFLKILAYLVPLVGLILDYTRAYTIEVALRTTEDKLRVARNVQQGLLPKTAPVLDGFDLAGSSFPAEAVGGDYFDFVPMQNGQMGIVVADVSGHEIGASILMAETRAYIRALAQTHTDVGPIMSDLNRFLAEDVQSRWFVSMFLARLDPRAATFVFAACGHEGYLFGSSGNVRTLESTSPPLGVLEDSVIACGPQTTLEPGAILLLVTDGIVETNAPDGQQFGLERVFAVVNRNRERTAREIVDALDKAAANFRWDGPQVDDLTIVVLKRNTAA